MAGSAKAGPVRALKRFPSSIVNFPLPRELRDEIYAYLLDMERVGEIVGPGKSQNIANVARPAAIQGPLKTYSFATELLRVNKTIGGEASHYLYTENRFMVVHMEIPGLAFLATMFDLPFVADITNKTFRQQDLSLSLRWDPCSVYQGSLADRDHPRPPRQVSKLMALKDLVELCDMVHFMAVSTLPHAMMVKTRPHEELALHEVGNPQCLQLKIRTLLSGFQPLQDVQKDSLLDSLLLVSRSLEDVDKVKAVQLALTASLVWPAAYISDYVSVRYGMVRSINKLAVAGLQATAYARLVSLWHWNVKSWRFVVALVNAIPNLTANARTQLTAAFQSMNHFNTNILFKLATLALLQSYPSDAQYYLDMLARRQHHFTSRGRIAYVHLETLWNLTAGAMSKPCVELTDLRTWVGALDQIHPVARDDRFSHDQALIKEWGAEEEVSRSATHRGKGAKKRSRRKLRELHSRLSLWSMPFWTYETQEDPDIAQVFRAEDFVGWQDTTHIAVLSEEDKLTIRKRQADMKIPLSVFD